MNSFTVMIFFIMFLIPIGIMLETADQLKNFKETLTLDMDNELEIARSNQLQLNMLQGVIIASVKKDKETERERVEQFNRIDRRLDNLMAYRFDRIHWHFENLLPYTLPKDRRIPLKP